MFDISIVKQEKFIDLPHGSKALYFLLGMEADDEGFVTPKLVMRTHLFGDDDLNVLIMKNFVIPFKSGVVVITDFKKNNWLDSRRLIPTLYQGELKALQEKDGSYSLSDGLAMAEHPLRQKRREESSIEENNINDDLPDNSRSTPALGSTSGIPDDNHLEGKLPKDNYALFVDYFNELTGRSFRATDKKARRQFDYLRKEGYKREDFAKVILNAYADRYHKESNYKYLTPEFLTRSDKFDRYFNLPDRLQFKKTMSEEEKVKSFKEKLKAELSKQ